MNIEIPKKFGPLINNAYQVARSTLRPISRKYDRGEHEYPKELDMLASVLDGFNAGDPDNSAGAATTGRGKVQDDGSVKNGANMGVCPQVSLCALAPSRPVDVNCDVLQIPSRVEGPGWLLAGAGWLLRQSPEGGLPCGGRG